METSWMPISTDQLRQQAVNLLDVLHLPSQDISESTKLFALTKGDKLIGMAGLDVLGSEALLRSVGVQPNQQSQGIGQNLVARIEAEAKSLGIKKLHLLTTSASRFFEQLEYQTIDRNSCPEEIQKSSQFTTVCPSSAVLMRKKL